jgi:hypothetical protein
MGVERIFPLHSPMVDKIDVVRAGRVRRAKLLFAQQEGKRSYSRAPFVTAVWCEWQSEAVRCQAENQDAPCISGELA